MIESKISDFLDLDYRNYAFHVLENRAIPSYIDGQKPTQRKIFFTALKHVINTPNKVSTLAGKVISDAMYHNGNVSCENSIVLMTQEFKNNIPYFRGIGQFGSLKNPFSSSSRYISVVLNKDILDIFKDNELLENNVEEGQVVEPKYYLPIIPLLLVNGSVGIALGYATNILSRSPQEITDLCISILKDKKYNKQIKPTINGFSGEFVQDIDNHKKWNIYGRYEIKGNSVIVSELIPSMSYQKYEEYLDSLVEKKIINSYQNFSKKDVNYLIKVSSDKLQSWKDDEQELIKVLKLRETETENFTTLDEGGNLKIFDSIEDITKDFVSFRLNYYQKRKDFLLNRLSNDLKILGNKGKFIKLILDGKIIVNNTPKVKIIEQIDNSGIDKIDDSYDYLLRMPIYSLTKEVFERLKEEFKEKKDEIEAIKILDPKDMYLKDLLELKKRLK
jgi:DNA gyrase/topoisomerase IV subunit A